jgi:restriction system protein
MPMRPPMLLLLANAKPPKAPDLVKPVAHGLEHSFIKLWPVWVLLGLIVLAKVVWQVYETHRLSKSGIAEIDHMSGHRFEEFLGTLFRRLGYRVEMTSRHGDYGADLVVTKGKTRTAVQAKRWSKKVGVKAVQEAVASKVMYACDSALVVANREFTQQAQKLARANKVELWGRAVLVDKLLAVRGKEAPVEQLTLEPSPVDPLVVSPSEGLTDAEVVAMQVPTTTAVTVTSTEPATCVACGAAVSEKVRAYCEQHAERFGGRIYCFKHQRGARAVPATD